jgi:hypothetical protein
MKALLLGRTVKVGNNYMCYDDEIHKVGYVLEGTGNAVYYADGPLLNEIIQKCEEMPDIDVVGIAADIALQEINAERNRKVGNRDVLLRSMQVDAGDEDDAGL